LTVTAIPIMNTRNSFLDELNELKRYSPAMECLKLPGKMI